MKKRTLVSLLFYFFISTKARNVREPNKTSHSMGDVIADMVRTFALSGENGPLASKLDKGKVGRSLYGNVFTSILIRMLMGEDKGNLVTNDGDMKQMCTKMLPLMLKVFKLSNLSKSCQIAVNNMLCAPLLNVTTIAEAAKKLLLHSPITKMLDAWQKIPQRILLGNTQWIGSYEECTNIPEAKYCNSELGVNAYGYNISIKYGSCFPKGCHTADVSMVIDRILGLLPNLEVLLKEKGLDKYGLKVPDIENIRTLCDNEMNFYGLGWQITMTVVAIFSLLCIMGTICEAIQGYLADNTPSIDSGKEEFGKEEFKMECGMNNTTFVTHSQLTINQSVSSNNILSNNVCDDPDATFRSPPIKNGDDRTSCNHLLDFLLCFSLLKNSRAIFSTDVSKGTIRSINGIRVISMTWIILGNYHLYGVLGLKTDNIMYVMTEAVHKFSFLVVTNSYVAVDSFFVLSGFLVSYLTLKKFGKTGMRCLDILNLYLHRYVRLTPSLGLVIAMYNFLPQILRGPMSLFIAQTDDLSAGCHDYWWANIFYFNNFYPSFKAGCLSWTAYLACDMQFYLLSPAIILLMLRIERKTHSRTVAVLYNFMFLMFVCFTSFLLTGIISYKYHLPSIPTTAMMVDSPYTTKERDDMIDMVYIKPYCRVPPYLVGLFLGYLISKDIKPSIKGIGKVINVTGWLSAAVGGLLVVYGPYHVFQEDGKYFSDAEVALYSACHRFVWGCAVAWVIYACHNKCGGMINTFLSWKIWMPLSRLTYSSFLIHLEIIYIYTFLKETPIHYQINETVFAFTSITVITYASAYVLAVCLEYPIMNLEKFIRRFF